MLILCVICRDDLIPSDEVPNAVPDKVIFSTKCGHVFHSECIIEWLNRSPTCPQCRQTITEKKFRRVYFTHLTNETISNSAKNSLLQEQVDNFKFQILLKDKKVKNFTEENVILKNQNAQLRREVRNVENEISRKNSKIYELKEKIRNLSELSSRYEVLEERLSITKKKLDEFERLKQSLSNGTPKVMKMIEKIKNPELINYICAMKKIIIEKDNKLTTYESHFKWQTEFCDKEQKELLHLKQYINSCKNENLALQNRIYELEELQNSEKNCIIKESSSQRSSNHHSLATLQPKRNIYNQTDTRPETKNQNDLPSPPWIEVVTDMNEEERILDTALDNCPSSIKKAKLSLQSGNDSNEINDTIIYDVGNISSMDKQSKKKNLKVKSF